MSNNENLHYDTSHLTTEEIRAICKSISDQILSANPDVKPGDVLEAPMEELQDEYAFWVEKLEERAHERTQATQDE